MGIHSRKALGCGVAAAALLVGGMVAAQTVSAQAAQPQAATNGAVAEVVVTARKHAENVQRVPVSITALSGDQLKQQSIKTMSNLQDVTPGLFVQQAGDDPQSIAITMRGRKQDDATMAIDPSVSVSVDGVVIPRTIGLAGAMIDIKRVEVLRGPQGTLYGRNSTGGAIGIYTNDPTDQLSGSIDVTDGDYQTWDVIGIANVPITDNLAARFVVQRGGNGGYEENTSGTGLGAEGSEYYRAKLKWTGADNWQAVLSGHYEHDTANSLGIFYRSLDPANFQGNGLPEGGYLTAELEGEANYYRGGLLPNGLPATDANTIALLQAWVAQRSPWYTLDNVHGAPPTSNVEKWNVGLDISRDVSDHIQFHSISDVQYLRRHTVIGFQAAAIIVTSNTRSNGTYYSQEFQLLGTTPTLNWVVGAYGGYETGADSQPIFFLPFSPFGSGGTDNANGILNTTLAGYAQATWEFVRNWHLTAGVRYTSDTRQVDANAFNVDFLDPTIQVCTVPAPGVASTPPGASQCPRTFRASFAKPTWLVSLDRQFTPNVLLYAKVATGYRSGGLNADGGSSDILTFSAFAPETNLEYEAGVKSTFFDRRVRLNLDGYWDDYTNTQVATNEVGSSGALLTITTNAARARIRGVEAEGDVIIGGGLRLHASGAYTDAHYLTYMDRDPITGLPIDRSHQLFPVPVWTYTLSANYTRPTGIGDASLEVDYAWKSAVDLAPQSPLPNVVTQPGYGLLNARLNLHIDSLNMDIAVFGKNLTDQQYFDQAANVAVSGFDLNIAYNGSTPRTVGVELVKKFGR